MMNFLMSGLRQPRLHSCTTTRVEASRIYSGPIPPFLKNYNVTIYLMLLMSRLYNGHQSSCHSRPDKSGGIHCQLLNGWINNWKKCNILALSK